MLQNLIKETIMRPQDNATRRIEYIDLVKGACVIYIVMLHVGFSLPIFAQILISIFYLISGYMFNTERSVMDHIKSKVNRILVPFAFFLLLGSAYFVAERLLFTADHAFSVQLDIVNDRFDNKPIWFLLALFWVNLIFLAIYKLFKREAVRAIIVFTLGIAAFMFMDNDCNYLKIGSGLIALPFFYIGYLLKGSGLLDHKTTPDSHLYIGMGLLAVSYVVLVITDNPTIYFNWIYAQGNAVWAYLLCFTCMMGFMLVCKRVKWLPFVSYIGRYSIIVLGIHIIYINLSGHILQKVMTDITTIKVIELIFALLMCWICIPVVARLFPKFCAIKPLIK